MRQERTDHTLQPTALVNEAYVRLTGVRASSFNNRVHFYGAAATIMRRILVDHAREHRSAKRGSGVTRVALDDAPEVGIDLQLDLVSLHDAINSLSAVAEQPARVVELRYF